MKKETFAFIRFGKLREFVENEVFGLKDLKFPSDEIEFDNIYDGDLFHYLKISFTLLNHTGQYSYTGVYHSKTGFLVVNKIKKKNNSQLRIIIDELSKDIEFEIIKTNYLYT